MLLLKMHLTGLRKRIQSGYWRALLRIVHRRAYLRHLIYSYSANYEEVMPEIDELEVLDTAHWTKRGRAVHLDISDVSLPDGTTSHWRQGMCGLQARSESLRKFKIMVENAEYERKRRNREGREVLIKYWTAGTSSLAAIGALVTCYVAFLGK